MDPRFHRAARFCAAALVVLGTSVLTGWAFDIDTLKSVLPSLATMKANTAASFVCLGIALSVDRDAIVRRVLALGVGMLAGVTLAEYVSGAALGVDHLLGADSAAFEFPGRMAFATSVDMLLLAVALLARRGRVMQRIARACVFAAAAVAFTALCGYIYGAQSLYRVGFYSSVALHTTIGFLLACAALVIEQQQASLTVLTGHTAAGQFVRRFAPAVIGIPVALGWLTLSGERRGWYDAGFGTALSVLATVGSLATLTWLMAGQLRRHEARAGAILETSLDGILVVDHAGRIVDFSPAAERLFGLDRRAVVGKPLAETIVPPFERDAHRQRLARLLDTGQPTAEGTSFEVSLQRFDGSTFPAEVSVTRVPDEEPPAFAAAIRDITERKRGFDRVRLAMEAAPIGMLMIDDQGTIVLANAQLEHVFGYPASGLLGERLEQLIPERFRGSHALFRREFLAAPSARSMGAGRELFGRRRDGTEVPVEIGLSPVTTREGRFVLASVVDITERKRADEERARLLAELRTLTADLERRVEERTRDMQQALGRQDVLLKEVHHRVKNNLAVISSLFFLERSHAHDAHAISVLEDSRRRIRSMALVHEALYRSDSPATIDFAAYARMLSAEVLSTFNRPDTVTLVHDLEPLTLDVDLAIPCGLILNELLVNALKHAFPAGSPGVISVSLRMSGDRCELRVKDDGVGVPAGFDPSRDGSVGMRLIRALGRQIRASIGFSSAQPGTDVAVVFDVTASPATAAMV